MSYKAGIFGTGTWLETGPGGGTGQEHQRQPIVPAVVPSGWASHGVAVPAQIFTLDEEGKLEEFPVDATHVTALAVQAPVNMAAEDGFKIFQGHWEMAVQVGEDIAAGDFLLVNPEAAGGSSGTSAETPPQGNRPGYGEFPYFGGGPPTSSNAALVSIREGNCVFFDASDVVENDDGTISPGDGTGIVRAERSIEVTVSKNDIFSCKYDDVPNNTGRVVKWNHANTDLYCCVGGGDDGKGVLTTDWVQTITPPGQAHTTCKFFGGGTPCNEIYPDLEMCCSSG